MRLPETITELKSMFIEVAETAVENYAVKHGDIKPYLSLREAGRKYGTTIVFRWIKEGLIHPRKDGNNTSKLRIDRIEIEAVSKACNRATYLTTKERAKK